MNFVFDFYITDISFSFLSTLLFLFVTMKEKKKKHGGLIIISLVSWKLAHGSRCQRL